MEQPEFALVARSHAGMAQQMNTVSEQMARCANLPAVNMGQTILDRLDQMSEDMNNRFDLVERRLGRLETDMVDVKKSIRVLETTVAGLVTDMTGVKKSVRVLDMNVSSRIYNDKLFQGDAVLRPLYDNETGEVIQGFPTTLGRAESLDTAQITPLLQQLGAPLDGSLTEKREAFLRAIGVHRN